ncbi:RNA helicase (dhr1)-like protein [Thermochaetoides thermophila DSM 1495]|uniref:RNA helicase n=1 Tax=Chaetomium thermophilum (strain DSM 1495 / CBS 144.50 / IMI 039719) TaxID=759272 RepID=G0SGT7_CHATD|nr:RNA helicase (dhr1)-like protein [Thermochaetoides thermophila DSM 1495]EGS17426.1 RNA helicase (dhr1)-like protein [Thermochaetoides thermophila DSM 1495]
MTGRKSFAPNRVRKRKVLDRMRAAENGTRDAPQDTNVLEITPAEQAERERKKAQLREELRPAGVKVSSKKAKRLEKYIENKLKKDENRELLAKLAANKIDTSLFVSAKNLGQTKETKRDALRRALKEQNAGLTLEKSDAELLYQRRTVADVEPRENGVASLSEDEEMEDSATLQKGARLAGPRPQQEQAKEEQPESEESEQQEEDQSEQAQPEQPKPVIQIAPGSGLKRPLELDESGRPKLAKRQKRGGVKSKFKVEAPVVLMEPSSEEWSGFSDDPDAASGAGSAEGSSQEESASESESSESDNSEESSDENEDIESSEAEAEDAESEDSAEAARRRQERSSAFKAWAQQARNEALGYKPVETGPLQIPKPANFVPRPLEEDPLPIELQPTTNVDRKAYAVPVNRSPEIQAARYQLPVCAEEHTIMEAIHNNDVVVICGATGSGKTTQIPQFLFEAGYGAPDGPTPGMIGVTQPRRVAAVSMSKRVAQEMGDRSDTVAYQIRFEGTVDPKTVIKFMTDGVLLREITQDLTLKNYSAIVIDEAHERSVNTDILIAILSRVVKLRADLAKENPAIKPLKLIIMSATLRVEEFTHNTTLFRVPPRVIEVEGRQHEVTIHFSRRTRHDYVEEAFRKICRGHRKLPPGGMLVFLTGQNEIMQLAKKLKAEFGGMTSAAGPKVRISASEAPVEVEDIDFGEADDRNVNDVDDYDDVEFPSDDEEEEKEFELEDEEVGTGPRKMHILPLYSLLPTKEQMKVFEPPPEGHRLVVLATNVAETSLTIPGIRYVFDCGRSKERRYNPVTGVQSFEIGWISKASAQQRAGRAGRTGPGHCWRLYSSAVYERDFPQFADPELLRMPIEGVVLQLKAMNLQRVVNFPFPTPPPRESIAKAEKLLTYLSAITPEGKVTPLGQTMSIFPLAPRYAKILLLGHQHDCLPYTIALVAGLSAGEIFIPESQAIPAIVEQNEEFRTNEDVIAEDKRARIQKAYNTVHKNFCYLDDKSDAIKLLQVVGEFAHEPTEEWCQSHFVRYKALKEVRQLQSQIAQLVRTNLPAFANFQLPDKMGPPTPKQVQALKQFVAAGFIDQVAIRADKAPNPPPMPRKPHRAIDVPYIPLIPLEDTGERSTDPEQALLEKLVYIHPSSPLAHLSVSECPEYIVYSHLQRGSNTGADGEKKAKIRMHALTDLTGSQLAALARGTPLISYGKPIKEVKGSESEDGKTREVWVIPYLRAETGGGLGWPLPARKVTQRRIPGKGWVVE